jgi:hypothetical protein
MKGTEPNVVKKRACAIDFCLLEKMFEIAIVISMQWLRV